MRVPLGVIGIIYESRPNVTIDAASLCLKSGNATILRGGSEAIHSNLALAECIAAGLEKVGLPPATVQVIKSTDRALVGELITMDQLGIQAISLSVQEIQEVIAGNNVTAVADVTLEDGSTLDAYDAWFDYDGSAAQDAFLFDAIAESAETLGDFNQIDEGSLDISLLVEGQDDITEAINDFVHSTESEEALTVAPNANVSSEVPQTDGLASVTIDELVNPDTIITQ